MHANHLSEELHKIGVINEITSTITNVDRSNPIFTSLIQSLEDLQIQRSHSTFSHAEGYTFIIFLNNDTHHISINESGISRIDGENYKVQEGESIKELFTLLQNIP